MDEEWEDYYEVLGVDPEASQEEIRKGYREVASILHPDALPNYSEKTRKWAEEKLKEINQAYEVLRDPQKRNQYDILWSEHYTPPHPVVEPSTIEFQGVEPGELCTGSFSIRNVGGHYTHIEFSDPDSWVAIVYLESVGTEELPLRVEVEAEGWDWDQVYSETIVVRLINEDTGVSNEAQVAVRLQTKPEPVRETYTRPTYTATATRGHTTSPQPPPKAKPKTSTKSPRGTATVGTGSSARSQGREVLRAIVVVIAVLIVFGSLIFAGISEDPTAAPLAALVLLVILLFVAYGYLSPGARPKVKTKTLVGLVGFFWKHCLVLGLVYVGLPALYLFGSYKGMQVALRMIESGNLWGILLGFVCLPGMVILMILGLVVGLLVMILGSLFGWWS